MRLRARDLTRNKFRARCKFISDFALRFWRKGEKFPRKKMARVLLHTCCGICAGHCVSLLQAGGNEVAIFYSNANIAPASEFVRRLDAVGTLSRHFGVPVIVDEPDHGEWLEKVARGFEDEPERGRRCPRCFEYSLRRAAEARRERGFDFFTTTLTVSPHKPSKVIFEIGKSIDAEHFLEIDFKKKGGFADSNSIARELGLYRQNYCGCEFSLRQRYRNTPPPSNTSLS